ncbi:MAG TPA: hypothetical protein VIM31_04000 [Candidatus Microsaccharimonas sp.]|jgi:hypothetical protein
MAENHYVDAKDQHEAATGVEDHSDLTTFYAKAKEEELGPWMQEADRQEALQAKRDQIILGLRGSAVLVGLAISLPVAIGIVLGQFFMTHVNLKNAIPIFFLILFGLGGFFALTFVLYKWVGTRFQHHNIRALPITLTTLLSLALIVQKVFDLCIGLIGGLVGYGTALVALVAIGIIIATVSIFIWTSPKLSWILKILVLFVFLGVASAVFYLV